MIKGALFDVDDTLFSHETEEVPRFTYKALDKLREKGIKIGICTSRVAAEMGFFPKELWDRVDCKIFGTGAITMIEHKYYKAYTIDKQLVHKYIDYFKEHNISYDYTDLNGDLFYWGNFERINNGTRLKYATGNIMFKEYEDEEITSLFFFEASDEEYEYIQNIDPKIEISRWGNSGNICAHLVDKSFGVLKFCQMYGFTTDEIVAAGDGGNDDLMLEMAGIGIATDDAKDNTKKAADYICTKSIEDGGLYDALVDLKIIDEDEYDPKMYVFDYDSTLYDHSEEKMQENTYKALCELKKMNKKLCLNTSRSYTECVNIPDEIMKMMDVIILSNGAYIIKDGKVETAYLSDETLRRLSDYFENNGITYRYVLDSGIGYLNQHSEKEELFKRLYDMVPEIKKYEGEKVISILYYGDESINNEVRQLLDKEELSILGFAGEVSPEGLNKGLAMKKIMEEFGFEKKDVCAFGDGGNDVEMLRLAGLGIAMGNGRQSCKDDADYITYDISDDGLYRALKHFNLLEEL